MYRRTLVLAVAATLMAACSGRRTAARGPDYRGMGGPVAVSATVVRPGDVTVGERVLEKLPWGNDVYRVNLSSERPVALTQVYAMIDDVLAVDTVGKVYVLSRRELGARWVSSLRAPLAAPPAETATHYVFLERDASGASWIEWFSKRSGTPGNASPVRLPFAPSSSGVAASTSHAFVGSLGSSVDNKTLEAINLVDGSLAWGYRTMGRVVASPMVDESGEILLVVAEDRTVTSLPTNQTGATATVNWVIETLGANTAAPALSRDWAFLGSDDNFLRSIDVHSGAIRWLKGLDAPVRKTPWLVGRSVAQMVPSGGEGSPTTRVESFVGYVFARNSLGLHAFVADSGEDVFRDPSASRPLVAHEDWVLTLRDDKTVQFRKGKGLPVVKSESFAMFDFLPTNGRDGQIIAGTANGMILLANPR